MEIWKDIPGYDGKYQASNTGRIRSTRHRSVQRFHELSQRDNGTGYLMVTVYFNGITKKMLVHRLVAMAFIDNPDNLPCVNHKDEDRQNNCVENLEWCDKSYNQLYSLERHPERRYVFGNNFKDKETGENTSPFTKKGNAHYDFRKVAKKTIDGELVAIYSTASEAAYAHGVEPGTIQAACKRNARTDKKRRRNYKSRAVGYVWEYC